MQGIKFVLVAVLAVSAAQCGADEFPISSDRVDLRLLVENGAAVARYMFKAVNTGLDQSKPHVDKILNELAPEASTIIRKTIDRIRSQINSEDKRITHIFSTLQKALDRLKPIKPCSDKVNPAAKKLALATEKEIANVYNAVEKKYKKEIDNIRTGTEKIVLKARTLFDTEVEAVIKCLTPGRKDAGACLNKEVEKIIDGSTGIVMESLILYQTANDTLSPILPEVIEKLLPLLEKVAKDSTGILKTLTDCVSALKPNL